MTTELGTIPRAARNIELKARLSSLDEARKIAERVATERRGTMRQVDTYFHCTSGRLKLREIDGAAMAELIWYARDDRAEARGSDYRIAPIPQPRALVEALKSAVGIRLVVDKRRELFLHHNVRIHLDEVAGLGMFLEFEAVLGPTVDDRRGAEQVAWLREQFGLSDEQIVSCSYSDLLEAAGDRITNT